MGLGGLGNPIVLLILLAIVLLIFGGRGRIPNLMGDMAKGINAFRSGLKDDKKGEEAEAEADAPAKTIDHDESSEAVKTETESKESA
ncbi:twin-arginine translocase TatA/TatE family subunit [Alphaproteobacteria bacterium]|jgi:sec-independent protein translocase protein TatA|nr:twin-arginine translocase TatA/TatE family subunit [Alphaproteobacteria bacterium]